MTILLLPTNTLPKIGNQNGLTNLILAVIRVRVIVKQIMVWVIKEVLIATLCKFNIITT